MTLSEQLTQRGFSSTFNPQLSDGNRFLEWRDPNLGKTGYKYTELTHAKGQVKRIIFKIWKIGEYETLWEYPGGLSKKEMQALELDNKKHQGEMEIVEKALNAKVAIEAKALWDRAITPKVVPTYLAKRGLSYLSHYKVDPQSVETMYIPVYNQHKEIVNLQIITLSGDKDFIPGGQVKGCYGLIPADGESLFVCEGFATAISIHLASKQAVGIVFGAQNYRANVPVILKNVKKDFVIIAADDDNHLDKNQGYIKAHDVSERLKLLLKIPVFKENKGKETTDFDDLRRESGIEEVAKQLSLSIEEKKKYASSPCVQALGYRDKTYFLTSSSNKGIQEFTSLGKENLFDLMPEEFWREKYGQETKQGIVVPWDSIHSELKEACRREGVYDGSKVRGVGVYWDEGRKVIHLGESLLVDGVEFGLREIKSHYTYVLAARIREIHEEQLSDLEMQRFDEILKMTTIKDKFYGNYITGWIASSVIAGMIDWRPHIYITGSKGSGKTQITEMINSILGSGFKAVYTQGAHSTGNGLRQKIGRDAIPLIIDEVEGDSFRNKNNAEGYIGMFRAASSNSKATTILGSPSQQAIEFKMGFCGWIAGITPQLNHDQDRVRFAMVYTKVDDTKSREIQASEWEQVSSYWASIDEEWSRKLVSRIINNAETISKNIKKTIGYLKRELDARDADQYGTLIGASFIFQHTNICSDQELSSMCSGIMEDLKKAEKNKDTTETECLNYILEAPLKGSGGESTTVARELTKPLMEENVLTILGEFGVYPKDEFIHIRKSIQISDHMRKYPMVGEHYMSILDRIKDAKWSTVKFNKKVYRTIRIPRSAFFTEEK